MRLNYLFATGLFALLCIGQISAQTSFSHSLGGTAYISPNVDGIGITYSPRLNVVEIVDEVTLSVGTHLGLGFNFSSDREGSSNSFVLDLPIVAELNFGHGANPDARSSFGGFVGFGYGISKMGAEDDFGVGRNDAAGLIVNGGIRAIIMERPVGLRVSYLLNSKSGAESVLGVGIFYNIGY
jgi:hypothetical protein